MNSSVNSETVIAYLKLKGWQEVKKDERYVHLSSPKQQKLEEPSMLYLPLQKLKGSRFYDLSIQSVIRTIGLIYDIKEKDMADYFTKSIDEIEREFKFHKAILAHT